MIYYCYIVTKDISLASKNLQWAIHVALSRPQLLPAFSVSHRKALKCWEELGTKLSSTKVLAKSQ